MIFRPGSGNQVADWTQLIAGAELYNNQGNGGQGGGAGHHAAAVITANSITIPGISAGNPPDLGSIADGASYTYYLKIWLNTSLGGSLPTTIDDQHVAFSITGSDVTGVSGHSLFVPATTTSSGSTNDQITVVASKINIDQQPSVNSPAYVALAQQPIFEAVDANNNRDLDINNAITVGTSNPNNLSPSNSPANFAAGLANFTGSGFNFHSTGTSTMNVSITGPSITSPNTSAITVTASTALGVSALAMSPSPLMNSTSGSISGGTATNAVLGFALQTTGSPLTVSQLAFTSSPSVAGLVQNFKLYSNTSDSFTGATPVASSPSLTFSGLSIPISGSPTYFYLVCDVDAYFSSLNPTISFSLPALAANIVVSAGNITGSTVTGTTYTLADNTPPTVSSINITPPPTPNAWSVTNGTSATSVTYLVTFSEPVKGVLITDFSTTTSGYGGNLNYPLVSGIPLSVSGGPTSYSVTVSPVVNSGILGLNFNASPTVSDLYANNPNVAAFTSSQTYQEVLPSPTNNITALNAAGPNTTSSLTLNWTNPASGTLPTHILVLGTQTGTINNPVDGTLTAASANFNGTNIGAAIVDLTSTYTATSSVVISGLNSGQQYTFKVFPYTLSPNNTSDNVDYLTAGTLSVTQTVPTASQSSITAATSVTPISSLLAGSNTVFTFDVVDDGLSPSADNAPTTFSQVVVGAGPSNTVGLWSTAIASAQLFDATGNPGSPIAGVIAPAVNTITFSGIGTAAGNPGYIAENATKHYILKITLKAPFTATIDDQAFDFLVNAASFTPGAGSSTIAAGQSQNTGAEVIQVVSTALAFTTQPAPTSQLVLTNFSTPPVVKAVDKNGNVDIDFNGAAKNVTFTNTAGDGMNPGGTSNFVLTPVAGIIDFSALAPSFQYADQVAGPSFNGTLLASGGGLLSNSGLGNIPCSAITVSYSNASTISNGTGILTISSITATPINVFSFMVKDDGGAGGDGADTKISQMKFTPNGTNQFSNFKDLIASATLSDNLGNSQTVTAISGLNATDITFSAIPFAAGQLGDVSDNATKTYTLSVVLNSTLTNGLAAIADDKLLVLDILQSNLVQNATGSTIPSGQSANSGTSNGAFQVIATKTSFITQPPLTASGPSNYYLVSVSLASASQPGGATIPSAEAVDANGNRDIDYSGANGTVSITSTLSTTGVPTSFTSGLLSTTDFGGMSFTTIGVNQTLKITPTKPDASGTPAAATSQGFDVKVGTATTLSAPTEIGVATGISSIANTQGAAVQVFSFQINEDAAYPPDDGNPTLISGMTFRQSSANDGTYLNDWTQAIAGATLSDGTTTITGTIAPTSISFSSMLTIPSFTTSDIGYIKDGGANGTVGSHKVYTLSIWLSPTLNATLQSNIDNKKFGFEIASSVDITTNLNGTQITAGSAIPASPQGNFVDVAATQIDYTTEPDPTSSGTNIGTYSNLTNPYIVLQARDANANTDLNYNGVLGTVTNSATTGTGGTNSSGGSGQLKMVNLPAGNFSAGVYSFQTNAPNFQFYEDSRAQQITLTVPVITNNAKGALPTKGVSTPFKVIGSYDSWMFFDPKFTPTAQVNFVNSVDVSGTGTTPTSLTSQALAKIVLSDGGYMVGNRNNLALGTHSDSDGAPTTISDFTVSFTNAQDISKVGLYTWNGTQIGSDYAGAASIMFTGLATHSAPDNDTVTFVIRAVFKQNITADQDQVKMHITAVTHQAGSDFPESNPIVASRPNPITIGGVQVATVGGDVSPAGYNYLDVVATSLDFTTQPSGYAGVSEPVGTNPSTSQPYSYGSFNLNLMPVTTAGVVTARDIYANIDTGFAPATISLKDAASNGITLPPSASFMNGVFNLNGMVYNVASGNKGAITVTTTTTGSPDPNYLPTISSPASSSGNAITCTTVNVLDVTVTQNYSGVISPTIAGPPPGANLKGGTTNNAIFGLTFTANSSVGNEPQLKGFYINFDTPFKTTTGSGTTYIFKNFVVKEISSAGTNDVTGPTISGIVTEVGVTAGSTTTYSQLYVNLSSKPQSLGAEPTKSISFLLIADVDAAVNLSTPKITPSFSDLGYGDPSDQNSIVSNGTSHGLFSGNQYSFASTNPPTLITAKGGLTSPYLGQDNVDPYLQYVTLQFDANVGSFDLGGPGNAEIWNRSTNTKVADLKFVLNASQDTTGVLSNNTAHNTYPSLLYKVVFDSAGLNVNPHSGGSGGRVFDYDQVYYITLPKGSYNAVTKTGIGITDFGLNFFGGISSNTGLYFKTSNRNAPVLNNASSSFNTSSLGTLTTNFNQLGTAYFMVLTAPASGKNAPPTPAQVKAGTYAGITTSTAAGYVAAYGSYPITAIGADQTVTFSATYNAANSYEVYVFAANDAFINGLSSPVQAVGVYGNSTANFAADPTGATAPTLKINGANNAPTGSLTPNVSNSNIQICPNSYVTISQPLIIAEQTVGQFSSGSTQDFNILLPTGFQFDVTVKPTIQLLPNGGDFGTGQVPAYSYKSSTLLNVSFTNSGASTFDYIVVSGVSVIGASNSNQGPVQCFYGSNTFGVPYFNIGTIAVNSIPAVNFVDSYWLNNKGLYNVIDPPGSASGDVLNRTTTGLINAIPDNYTDANGNSQVDLKSVLEIPSLTTNSADYLGSTFSGSGVSGGTLTLNAVILDAPFNVSMVHTDLNGCTTSKSQQYLVYTHHNPISDKLGSAYVPPSPLSGAQQAIVNKNWPASAAPIALPQPLAVNEKAGYTLNQLHVDLPASEIALNFPSSGAAKATQFMSGSAWRSLIRKSIIADTMTAPFRWDYASILNAAMGTLKSSIYSNDPSYNPKSVDLTSKLTSAYDYFYYTPLSPNGHATPLKGYQYWPGGSLGKVEFTAIYNSTADNSVYVPIRQNVELFLPAVPVLEVTSAAQKPDTSDPTTGVSGFSVQTLGAIGKLYPAGYPGTSIFCEHGGLINISGYPLATAGTSTGVFGIYDYASYSPAGPNTQLANTGGGFVDAANGTMTLDPTLINNGYNDILVTYTYQANNSPAVGTGYLVIRVTPNPVPQFTLASVTGVANSASTQSGLCTGNPINFDASSSSIAQPTHSATANMISKYAWSFGDPNSGGPNSLSGAAGVSVPVGLVQKAPASTSQTFDKPQHYFNISQQYTITLNLTSNWGCPSLTSAPTVAPDFTKATPTVAGWTGVITVGDVPTVNFSFLGNCVSDPIAFTDGSSTPAGANSVPAQYDWDFGDGQSAKGYNLAYNPASYPATPFVFPTAPDGTHVSHVYTGSGNFRVILKTTTDLGCLKRDTLMISQLPIATPSQAAAFTQNFNGSNGGWVALTLDPTKPSSWTFDQNRWQTEATPGVQSYYASENSALYTACLDLSSIPRPVVQFDGLFDFGAVGEGLVVQYSTDQKNIQDKTKSWTVLGTTPTGVSPGLDWYANSALPTSPGTSAYNPSGLGWSGTSSVSTQPKHKLEDIGTTNNSRVILRFALASQGGGGKGVWIDNFRVGSRTRTVLLENFTTTNGGPANGNIVRDDNDIAAFITQNLASTQVVNINYHVGFLGQDPFNLLNPADPGSRALYYHVEKIPYAFLDGLHPKNKTDLSADSSLFLSWGQSAYDLQTLNLAKADFLDPTSSLTTVTTNNADGSVEIKVQVTPRVTLPTGVGKTVLYAAVLEKSVQLPAEPNGETQFNYVLRKMLPNAEGTPVTMPLDSGKSISLGSLKWVADKYLSNSLSVVVWLQNETTKEVYQAELFDALPLPPTVTGVENLTSANVGVYPNPSDQEFTIELPEAAVQATTIQLTSELGQTMHAGTFEAGEQTKTISTRALPAGIYILQLGANGSAMRTKLIVMHK